MKENNNSQITREFMNPLMAMIWSEEKSYPIKVDFLMQMEVEGIHDSTFQFPEAIIVKYLFNLLTQLIWPVQN